MTIAELLAFDVAPADASLHIQLSKEEPNQYSTLPYPTLQTRDAFLATDALINARKNGFRSLAVVSTRLPLGADRLSSHRAKDVQRRALRTQRWMDKIVLINGTDRNRIAVARRILNGLQWQEQDGLLPLPLLGRGMSLVYLLRLSSHDWLGEAAMNLSIESVLRADGLTFNLHIDDTMCRSRMRTTPYYSEDLSLMPFIRSSRSKLRSSE